MIKWPLYIMLFMLISIPGLSFAKPTIQYNKDRPVIESLNPNSIIYESATADTLRLHGPVRQNKIEFVKKIKEVAKAKNQAKPEKIETPPDTTSSNKPKVKPPRQRRPEGMERPPEIPRRNND